jgi:hypothetical protein
MKIDVDIFEKKMESPMAQYGLERRKVDETKKSGIGADYVKVVI